MTDRELLYTGLKEFLPEVSEKMIDDLLKFSALLLDKESGDIEILMDYETRKTVRLIELIPEWWGHSRFK